MPAAGEAGAGAGRELEVLRPERVAEGRIRRLSRLVSQLARGVLVAPALIGGAWWTMLGMSPGMGAAYGWLFFFVVVPGSLVLGAMVGAARVHYRYTGEIGGLALACWLTALATAWHAVLCGLGWRSVVVAVAFTVLAMAVQGVQREDHRARRGRGRGVPAPATGSGG